MEKVPIVSEAKSRSTRETVIVPPLELNSNLSIIDELADLTMFLQRHLFISLGEQASERKLSVPQYNLLTFLSFHEALNMSTLAQLMGHTTPATTGLVDRLHKAGLVERTTSEIDRRVVLIRITEEGGQLVREMRREVVRLLKDVAENISDEDQQAWLRINRIMHDYCAERRNAAIQGCK